MTSLKLFRWIFTYAFGSNRLKKLACLTCMLVCALTYLSYTHFLGEVRSRCHIDKDICCVEAGSTECLQHFFPIDNYTDENYFYMNVNESIAIPMTRTSTDGRCKLCKSLLYNFEKHTPKVSVIMGFVNEHWSVLLRTVFSVILHSPAQLLHEIILVDDASELPFLKDPLEKYLGLLPLVKLYRSHVEGDRGTAHARILGASYASGDVMIFLDSHIEVSPGWLEPMLAALAEDKRAVVYPRLGVLTSDTLNHIVPGAGVGAVSWTLGFRWLPFCTDNETSPMKSSCSPGGAWAINSEFYHAIGGLEKGMTGWGGEDVELSLRVQLCAGGNIKGIPCSYVYHLYKKGHPYKSTYAGYCSNIKKMSILYMNEIHKDIPLMLLGCSDHQLTAKESDELKEMKESREMMNCKTFDSLTTHYQPYIALPGHDDQLLGTLRNTENNLCIQVANHSDSDAFDRLVLAECCQETPEFTITKYGQIKRLDTCMTLTNEGELVLANCSSIEKKIWMRGTLKRIYHFATGKCLRGIRNTGRLVMDECKEDVPSEQWEIPHSLNWKH